MRIIEAANLRRKTAALRGLERTLKMSARLNQWLYFRYAKNPHLTSTERRARMAERSIAAREIEELRGRLQLQIELHRFAIILHNEGMASAETEARAV